MPLRQRPRRRLPDLCWMAVFKAMTPADQVSASRMNSRSRTLVRAANRRVRSLVITSKKCYDHLKYCIKPFSVALKPSMKLLSRALVGDYPISKTRLNEWNCINILHLPSTEELVTIFSALTDLKFISTDSRGNLYYQYLVDLLLHPNWAGQLTSFMLSTDLYLQHEQVFGRLCLAINGLSSLQHLAIDIGDYLQFPDLPVIAQLQGIVLKLRVYQLNSFLASLEDHASDNVHLKVHLLSYYPIYDDVLHLSEPARSRLVRIGGHSLKYSQKNVNLLYRNFSNLTTVSLVAFEASHVGPLFTALSKLSHLLHLKLRIFLNEESKELSFLTRPKAQLMSLRALDLKLNIQSHSQVAWLNLHWTMPHLQAIHLQSFECKSCQVNLLIFGERLNSLRCRECLGDSLLPYLHGGVDPKRIIFKRSFDMLSPFLSFYQL